MQINWSAIQIALFFVVFDFVTGLLKAVKNKNVSSSKMREGLFHKVSFVGAIALAVAAEFAVMEFAKTSFDLGYTLDIPFTVFVCGYIVLTEIASICENLSEINPELKDSPILSIFDNKQD